MGQIANRAEAMRRITAAKIYLMGSTNLTSAPPAPQLDMAEERIAVATAYLARRPFVLHNPFDRSVIWVESEPDDWRELLAAADAEVLARSARKGRMH